MKRSTKITILSAVIGLASILVLAFIFTSLEWPYDEKFKVFSFILVLVVPMISNIMLTNSEMI